jgi:hypothetical protein
MLVCRRPLADRHKPIAMLKTIKHCVRNPLAETVPQIQNRPGGAGNPELTTLQSNPGVSSRSASRRPHANRI